MKPRTLSAVDLSAPGFSEVSFHLRPAQWLRLSGGPHDACGSLVDAIFGLGPIHGGDVAWDETPISICDESQLLDLATRTAFVHHRGGLLLNLRIWENLLLPLVHHDQAPDIDALETEILEAFATAGIGEAGASHILHARTDDLSSHEILIALLIRAHLMRPAILISESIFDGLPHDSFAAITGLLDFIAARNPGLSLFTIGDAPAALARITPAAWPDPETLNWKENSWLAS